jgi:hypothetical protein
MVAVHTSVTDLFNFRESLRVSLRVTGQAE